MSQSDSPAEQFMQVVPHYKVRWSDGFALTVTQDDLQAVVRSVIRSYPERKITLEPVSPIGNQFVAELEPDDGLGP